MEAYVWLPPGCFPDQTEAVFRWAVNTFRGQVGMGDNNESSLLETLVNPDDDPLGVMSPYYCQVKYEIRFKANTKINARTTSIFTVYELILFSRRHHHHHRSNTWAHVLPGMPVNGNACCRRQPPLPVFT